MNRKPTSATLLGCLLALLPQIVRAQRDTVYLDGRNRTVLSKAGLPSTGRPHLGLWLWNYDTGERSRCLILRVVTGPLLPSPPVQPGDVVLAFNDVEVNSAAEFRRELEKVSPGTEVRLRVERGDRRSLQDKRVREAVAFISNVGFFGKAIGGGAVETVSVRPGSFAEWAPPINWFRPRPQPPPDTVIAPGAARLEQFIATHLKPLNLKGDFDRLVEHLANTADRFSGANMLSRVAYAYRHPARLAELQASVTGPFARIVDETKDQWSVPSLVLAETARNLDVAPQQQRNTAIEFAHPDQAIQAFAGRMEQADAELDRAFRQFDAARRKGLADSLAAATQIDSQWAMMAPILTFLAPQKPNIIQTLQASMSIDFAGLFAAAEEVVGWRPAGAPPTGAVTVALPGELEGAVKGDVLAASKINGRWYVFGGVGRNEYDLSRIDVAVDAGGNDLYRYPGTERPRVQLVVDWSGDDRYVGENGAPGPASALLGVSVVIDHQGNDRYEGGVRSCGVGAMGIGVIVDHSGRDNYKGTRWSLGAGFYGFGGIVDLESATAPRHLAGSDHYVAEADSQAIGGPRGFGLILDQSGLDRYGAFHPEGHGWGQVVFAQGVGKGIRQGDTGGIGLLCDLAGDDRYEAGGWAQGFGTSYGLGILYDRSGNDLYSGGGYTQGTAAHGGVGILADDDGDDTHWSLDGQARAKDNAIAMMIDRRGNDSYQSGVGIGFAEAQGMSWFIDLEGQDRYIADVLPDELPPMPPAGSDYLNQIFEAQRRVRIWGLGQSVEADGLFNFLDCGCFSFAIFIDTGGSRDMYPGPGWSDGAIKSTGVRFEKRPELSPKHGLFIDTAEQRTIWPRATLGNARN